MVGPGFKLFYAIRNTWQRSRTAFQQSALFMQYRSFHPVQTNPPFCCSATNFVELPPNEEWPQYAMGQLPTQLGLDYWRNNTLFIHNARHQSETRLILDRHGDQMTQKQLLLQVLKADWE